LLCLHSPFQGFSRQMPSSSPFKGDESYLAFLASYPFAAFVLDARPKSGKEESQLHPVYANAAFLRLIHGPASTAVTQPTGPLNTALLCGLVDSLADVHEARRLADWLQCQKDTDDAALKSFPPEDQSIILSFRPSWLSSSDPPLRREVVKTFMRGFWVCITVPRKHTTARTPSPPSPSLQSRRTTPKLCIPNLPLPPTFPRLTTAGITNSQTDVPCPTLPVVSGSGSVASNSSIVVDSITSYQTGFHDATLPNPLQTVESAINFPLPKYPGEMAQMIQNYPWEKSPLGPRSKWSQALETALSICIQSPLNVSDIVLSAAFRPTSSSRYSRSQKEG
jgi:hypothetical protein